MSFLLKEASATEYSVSHVSAQLAGAKYLKEETAGCVSVLYLSFGYIREAGGVGRVGGIWTSHSLLSEQMLRDMVAEVCQMKKTQCSTFHSQMTSYLPKSGRVSPTLTLILLTPFSDIHSWFLVFLSPRWNLGAWKLASSSPHISAVSQGQESLWLFKVLRKWNLGNLGWCFHLLLIWDFWK